MKNIDFPSQIHPKPEQLIFKELLEEEFVLSSRNSKINKNKTVEKKKTMLQYLTDHSISSE